MAKKDKNLFEAIADLVESVLRELFGGKKK
jgi:hypothetical protein